MATQVSVISTSTGVQTFYPDYASARAAASAGDRIQIWADIINEIIKLKDQVDIWIAPGRIISMTSSGHPTITDDNAAVTCNIFGNGIIKNSYIFGGVVYECIKISNGNSKVSIVCDYIEGLGGDDQSSFEGASVLVNSNDSSSFRLICNKIINKKNAAVIIQNPGDSYLNQINIKSKSVETGLSGDSDTGSTAMIIEGGGFIEIDEVICRNYGSCLLHKRGTLIANIFKLTTNNSTSTLLPTISVSDGDGTQNLTLYFDEIQNIGGGDAVKVSQGRANIIGRRIYSNSGLALNLVESIVSAIFQCVEIISGERCININNSDEQIIIDANYIEGNTGSNDGVVYSNNAGNFVLRNAKIKNLRTSGSSPFSLAIYLGDTGTINMMIENIICVTGDSDEDAKTIISASLREVKNLGLFVNRPISGITLKIGDASNKKYIENSLIS